MKTKVCVMSGLIGTMLIALVAANTGFEPLPRDVQADRIIVEKSARRLSLLRQGKPIKMYSIALGSNPVGPKACEGDRRTPEGSYQIDSLNPNSAFHRALHLSYPNSRDAAAARKKGCSPGGAILIHGIRNGLGWLGRLHRLADWTAGCIAVTNPEIEEILRVVPVGTPIKIMP